MACILVERGLPFLLTGCQGRLPAAWVNYDIQTSWVGGGFVKEGSKSTREYRETHPKEKLNGCTCT